MLYHFELPSMALLLRYNKLTNYTVDKQTYEATQTMYS